MVICEYSDSEMPSADKLALQHVRQHTPDGGGWGRGGGG